ncbi:Protein dopey-1 [Cichlidogyrus casuarinus]|uniref:Protein dopey-1 n=1 Tax=Cichlidogyrus casuarinus TaxID=1844966 RepID=A0ABD2QEI3_9PLAT
MLTGLQCNLLALMTGRKTVVNISWYNDTRKKYNQTGGSDWSVGPLLAPSELVPTIKELIKQPPASLPSFAGINHTQNINPHRLRINLLHFFYAWISTGDGLLSVGLSPSVVKTLLKDLLDSAGMDDAYSESCLFRDHSCFSLFIPVARILNGFIISTSLNQDQKKQVKDLQDISQRLLESLAQLAASALEQPTWFRRTLQVKQGAATNAKPRISTTKSPFVTSGVPTFKQFDVNIESMKCSLSRILFVAALVTTMTTGHETPLTSSRDSSMLDVSMMVSGDVTLQAFLFLSQHISTFIDLVFDKDKVATILTNIILPNVYPYLKTRCHSNLQHFAAASNLLACISPYQLTRRAWRKELFDILIFDLQFFQMNSTSLLSWVTIVDNLMTQDKSTFPEALCGLKLHLAHFATF